MRKAILDFFEMFFNHLKLSLYRVKIILFGTYVVVVAYNYFVKIVVENKKWNISLQPSNIPVSAFITIGIVFVFLILADIIHNNVRSKNYMKIIKDDNIPIQIREKALENMSKIN